VDRVGRLHDLEAETERVPAEDVAHVVAAHDDHLKTGFLGDRLQSGGAHLARAPDREAVSGDDERLTGVNAFAESGHQVAERTGLPALVERVEAFRYAVLRRRDLVGVDRVQLRAWPAARVIPE